MMINDEVDEVLEKLQKSLKKGCLNNLESMRGSEFAFDYVFVVL